MVDPRDPVLGFDLVLRIAQKHVPTAKEVTGVDESGGQARAYFIDEQLVLKVQRPHKVEPRTSLAREAFHLPQLAQHLPELPVPRLFGYGREGSLEYLLISRVAGVPVWEATPIRPTALPGVHVEGEARAALLRDLGRLLRRLHSLPSAPLRESGLYPGDRDSGDTRRRVESLLAGALAAIRAEPGSWELEVSPETIAARVRECLAGEVQAPMPLHSNPGPEHVLIDPDSLRLCGLIDFGDAYFSHPAFDARRWVLPEDQTAILQGYAEAGSPLSAAFYHCWHAVVMANLLYDVALRPRRRAHSLVGLRSTLMNA